MRAACSLLLVAFLIVGSGAASLPERSEPPLVHPELAPLEKAFVRFKAIPRYRGIRSNGDAAAREIHRILAELSRLDRATLLALVARVEDQIEDPQRETNERWALSDRALLLNRYLLRFPERSKSVRDPEKDVWIPSEPLLYGYIIDQKSLEYGPLYPFVCRQGKLAFPDDGPWLLGLGGVPDIWNVQREFNYVSKKYGFRTRPGRCD